MRAVLLTGHGGPEVLDYRDDVPVPVPGPGDVLVRVAAAGINNTDINTRTAWYSKQNNEADDATWSGVPLTFPRIQGADVCGTIVDAGQGVDPKRIGERVILEPCLREAQGQSLDPPWYFGSECNGGFAEFTTIAARHAHAINSRYTDVELASFPCSYSTAENMLTRAQVKDGDRVFITGASGGVGSAAIQLSKARGATVIAVTSQSKEAALRAIGADDIILRDENYLERLDANSIDVVVDLVAGPQWPMLLDLLRQSGRYAASGAIGGPIVELDVRTLYLKDLSFYGCTVLEPSVFGRLVDLIEREQIQPLIAKTFPMQAINEAQAEFLSKRHIGKFVLTIAE